MTNEKLKAWRDELVSQFIEGHGLDLDPRKLPEETLAMMAIVKHGEEEIRQGKAVPAREAIERIRRRLHEDQERIS